MKNPIPSRELYNEFVSMGNCSYSYEEIVSTINEATAADAEYESTIEAAWRKFDDFVGGVDFLFMSDAQRKLQGRLSDLINECVGISPFAGYGSKELVPVRRIQKSIKATRKQIKRINEFEFVLS